MAFQRTGPELALDGKPKFDLTQFDQTFFDRLRTFVTAARDKGIYASVMLFQGFRFGAEGLRRRSLAGTLSQHQEQHQRHRRRRRPRRSHASQPGRHGRARRLCS